MKSVEKECLINCIGFELDTRDKRFMFLKICFPEVLPFINLEGSPRQTSSLIVSEFEKRNMLGSLTACMNTHFDLKLEITYN